MYLKKGSARQRERESKVVGWIWTKMAYNVNRTECIIYFRNYFGIISIHIFKTSIYKEVIKIKLGKFFFLTHTCVVGR